SAASGLSALHIRCDPGNSTPLMIDLFPQPLAPGSSAPDFELPDQDGSLVTLASLKGRNVVLVFYPADDTSVCTKQLCEFRDRWPLVQARNTMVFGVNP